MKVSVQQYKHSSLRPQQNSLNMGKSIVLILNYDPSLCITIPNVRGINDDLKCHRRLSNIISFVQLFTVLVHFFEVFDQSMS